MEINLYLDSLVGDDKATMKASIQAVADVEPGVDVQAYDADLTTWGAKTAPSGTVLGTTDTQTMTNKSIVADSCFLVDGTDNTKKLQVILSGFSTATTRQYTFPNASGTLALLSATQTFSGDITFSGTVTITNGTNGLIVRPASGAAPIQMGRVDGTTTTCLIDFNTGATAVDYDARIQATGGTGSIGGGAINFLAATLNWNSNSLVDVATSQTLSGLKTFSLPPRLPTYTVATVPSASTYSRGLIYVSDGTSNKRLAISDGTNWRWPDGAIVS